MGIQKHLIVTVGAVMGRGMVKLSLVALATLIVAGQASAQTCGDLNGTLIAPISFSTAADEAPIQDREFLQDEFETRIQYRDRLAALLAKSPGPLLVSVPFDLSNVRYDADSRAFKIESSAINRVNFTDWPGIISDTYLSGSLRASHFNISLVLNQLEAIFERNADVRESLFTSGTSSYVKTWSVPMDLDRAREVKMGMKAAIQIVPEARFIRNLGTDSSPIYQNVLIADMQCVFITDSDGKVLMSDRTS